MRSGSPRSHANMLLLLLLLLLLLMLLCCYVVGVRFLQPSLVVAHAEAQLLRAAGASQPLAGCTRRQLLRSSAIISAQFNPSPHVSTRLTTYLQSDFKRWADSRAYVEWIWDVSITEKVAFEWNLGVRWDGEPHANLNAWDLGSTMGLRFGFNGN